MGRKRWFQSSFAVLCAAFAIGCGGGGGDGEREQEPSGSGIASFASVQSIFNTTCATPACHAPPVPASLPSLTAADAYEDLFGQPATTSAGTRVIPFEPGTSVLFRRISPTGDLGRMPPTGALTAAQVETIRTWIDEGASRNGELKAFLSPGQAVADAVVTSDARGKSTVSLNEAKTEIAFSLTIDPLPVSTINLIHIHAGGPGENGGVLFTLFNNASGGFPPSKVLTGTLTEANFTAAGTVTTFAQAVNALIRGSTYFQVHTQTVPAGELRGHIGPARGAATLAAQPPLAGTGTATVTLNSDQDALAFALTFEGLTGPPTVAHIHRTAPPPAVNGPVLFPLMQSQAAPAGSASGLLTAADAQPGANADQFTAHIDDVLSGNAYVNVHTQANPDGEIRGDIGPAQ
jgi:hypothetical protein